MTIKEAIETIKIAIAEVEWEYPMDYAVAFDMAIDALRTQAEAGHKEPLTNADRIRAMSDEELTMFFVKAQQLEWFSGVKAKWLDWLKQPAEEDNNV